MILAKERDLWSCGTADCNIELLGFAPQQMRMENETDKKNVTENEVKDEEVREEFILNGEIQLVWTVDMEKEERIETNDEVSDSEDRSCVAM